MHAVNLKLMVALPAADWSYDYKYISPPQADAVILMNYDLHYPTSDPGPIASQDWFECNIENILKIVPAGQNHHGHRELWLRLAGEDRKQVPHPSPPAVTFQQAHDHRCGIASQT